MSIRYITDLITNFNNTIARGSRLGVISAAINALTFGQSSYISSPPLSNHLFHQLEDSIDNTIRNQLLLYAYSEHDKETLTLHMKPYLADIENESHREKIVEEILTISGSLDEKITLLKTAYPLFPKHPEALQILFLKLLQQMSGSIQDKIAAIECAIKCDHRGAIRGVAWLALASKSAETIDIKIRFMEEISAVGAVILNERDAFLFGQAYTQNLDSMSLEEQISWLTRINTLVHYGTTHMQQLRLSLLLMSHLPNTIDEYLNVATHLNPGDYQFFCDEIIDELQGYRVINRDRLKSDPWGFIEHVVSNPHLPIQFENEPGIDGGGLWREFVLLTFKNLVNNGLTRDPQTGFVAPDPRITNSTRFYTLGRFIKTVVEKGGTIGPFFKPEFYEVVALIPQEELNRDNLSIETSFKIVKIWLGPVGESVVQLCQNSVWSGEQQQLADIVTGSDNATHQDVAYLIAQTIPGSAIASIAKGVSAPHRANLQTTLEGEFDRFHIAAICIYEGSDQLIHQQLDWLKEWILESDENGRRLVQFATSSPTLPQQFPKIAIISHENRDVAVKAATCFGQLSFPSIFYRSKEDFILALTSSIEGPGFSDK